LLSTPASVRPIWCCEKKQLTFRSRVLAGLIFGFFGIATFFLDWQLRLLAADDSYIHLRIARNLLATGHAFFNAHERVMVTSSPLWTMLLALSTLVFRHIPPAIPLEALCLGGVCALSFVLACKLSACQTVSSWVRASYLALVPLLLFAVLLQSTVYQMETSLAILLLVAGMVLWQNNSPSWFAILVMAGWARYEFFLVASIFFAFALLNRRMTRKAAIAGIITFVVGCAWLLAQFGTLIPNTIKAKAVAYLIPWTESYHLLGFGIVRPALLAITIMGILSTRPVRRQILAPNILLAAGIGLAVLYVARKTAIFPWYRPLTIAPIVLGLLLGPVLVGKTWTRAVALCAALMFVQVHSLPQEILGALRHQPWRDETDMFNVRANEYVTVGRAIESVCPQARLMTSEIGGLGEGFHGEILDGLGLASPAAIKFHPMPGSDRSSGAIPYGYVLEEKPDVIVTYNIFSKTLRQSYNPGDYTSFVYPPLPASEAHFHWLQQSRLYVLVANRGSCQASSIDEAVSSAISSQ
jgi:hypothetical protein